MSSILNGPQDLAIPTGDRIGYNIIPELVSMFDCPICLEYMQAPILQCPRGHLICLTCRAKLSLCPTCRCSLTYVRNLALEHVASVIKFRCKYFIPGCTVVLSNTEKLEHERSCEFKPYLCPLPVSICSWVGPLDRIMEHLEASHNLYTSLQGESITAYAVDINLYGNMDWVMVQSCFSKYFVLVLRSQQNVHGEKQFTAIVKMIGTRVEANMFIYRLELKSGHHRILWESETVSIREEITVQENACLTFDAHMAKMLSEGGNLSVKVNILSKIG